MKTKHKWTKFRSLILAGKFSAVNVCVRIKFCVLDEDADGLFEMLNKPVLGCEELLHAELKSDYLLLLKEEYTEKDKNFVLLNDDIRSIVLEALDLTSKRIISNCSLFNVSFIVSLTCLSF